MAARYLVEHQVVSSLLFVWVNSNHPFNDRVFPIGFGPSLAVSGPVESCVLDFSEDVVIHGQRFNH